MLDRQMRLAHRRPGWLPTSTPRHRHGFDGVAATRAAGLVPAPARYAVRRFPGAAV